MNVYESWLPSEHCLFFVSNCQVMIQMSSTCFRSDTWAGVSQNVDLQPNSNYHFTIHFKSLNQFTSWISVDLLAAVDYGK